MYMWARPISNKRLLHTLLTLKVVADFEIVQKRVSQSAG
jgi:hypothetical protein